MIGTEDMGTIAPCRGLDFNAFGLDLLVIGSADSCDGAIARLLDAPCVVGSDGTSADYRSSAS